MRESLPQKFCTFGLVQNAKEVANFFSINGTQEFNDAAS
eukprot:COSAG04_NODE_29087_length_271_cov_0.761628_1_plen_38_part_01